MNTNYQDSQTAQNYLNFLNSSNGQIQQKVLLDAIRVRIPNTQQATILDAGCGSGWLAGALKKEFANVEACDSSEFLIQFARGKYPEVDFKIAGLESPLPYSQSYFDVVVLNMVAPDLEKLNEAFKNLSAVMKPGAKLLMTIPNPKYTYPAAEWKRSLADILLGRKPKLIQKIPPAAGKKIQREFGKFKINSYFYTLDNYLDGAENAGLHFFSKTEIKSKEDSPNFDLNYQLFRYPLIQLLEFKKTA